MPCAHPLEEANPAACFARSPRPRHHVPTRVKRRALRHTVQGAPGLGAQQLLSVSQCVPRPFTVRSLHACSVPDPPRHREHSSQQNASLCLLGAHILASGWERNNTHVDKVYSVPVRMPVGSMGFPGGSVAKNLPASAGDASSIPGPGRSPGEGNGNPLQYSCLGNPGCNGTPLQYSCLENPMDGGAWWAAVHGVTKSRTRLRDFTFTFYFHALEKEMATHSSVLAWRIPGTREPGGLPSMGSHRVGHD